MKNKIDNFMRLLVMIFTMVVGFFTTYALVWIAVGLPQTNWAMYLLCALAGLSMLGYILWVREK